MRAMIFPRLVALGGLALLISVSCGEPEILDVNRDNVDDGTSSTTVIAPSNPIGTVTGLVLDAVTSQPLSSGRNVFVRLVAGTHDEEITINDGSGRFAFEYVPAGVGISVTISSDGYATAYATAQLDAEVGNFPADNAHVFVGPVELVELNGAISALVLGPDGRPVPRTDVLLDTDFAYLVDGVPHGRLHRAQPTDDNGLVQFTDVPDAARMAARLGNRQLLFTVPPPDLDSDGDRDLTGAATTLSLADAALRATPVVIVLGYPTGSTPLRVVASNVADLVNPTGSTPKPVPTPSVLPKSGDVIIAFNQPVDSTSFLFRLVAEQGGNPFIVAPSFSDYGNVVTVPLPEALQGGQEYNLYLEARPSDLGEGGAYRGAVAFFIESIEEPHEGRILTFYHEEVNGSGQIDSGDYIWFHFSLPVGGRTDDGQAALPSDLLPIRVQVVGIDVNGSGDSSSADHPFESAYVGELQPPSADVIELLPPGGQYTSSGYSTRLRLTLPADVRLQEGNSHTFRLTFNDPVGASATQRLRVSTPEGVLPAPQDKGDILSRDARARDAG